MVKKIIQINGIGVLDNGLPTLPGIDLMERVIIARLDLCNHLGNHEMALSYARGWLSGSCLLTSLNAWRHIWDRMDDGQRNAHYFMLKRVKCDRGDDLFMHELYPYHHLEALARVLTVECEPCEGKGEWLLCEGCEKEHRNEHCKDICDNTQTCDDCNGTGIRTVLDLWTEKWSPQP